MNEECDILAVQSILQRWDGDGAILNKPFAYQLWKLKELGAQKQFVLIGIGYLCHNNCIFCFKPTGNEQYLYNSIQTYKRLIEENRKLKIEKVLLAGIEVFTHPRVFEVLKLLKDNGFKEVEVMTTGEFFAVNEFAKDIIDSGVTSIATTLYGIKSTHDHIVGREGSFSLCIKGLMNLKQSKRAKIYIHTLLLKQNLKEMRKLALLVEKMELPFAILHVRPKEEKTSYANVMPSYTEIVKELQDSNLNFINFPLCVLKKLSPRNFERVVGSKRKYEQQLLLNVEEDISDITFFYSRFVSIKPDKCNRCVVKDFCSGTFDQYLKIYGDEELEPFANSPI